MCVTGRPANLCSADVGGGAFAQVYLRAFLLWAAAHPPSHKFHSLRARNFGGVIDEVVCHSLQAIRVNDMVKLQDRDVVDRYLRLITGAQHLTTRDGQSVELEAMTTVPRPSARLVSCVDPEAIMVDVKALAARGTFGRERTRQAARASTTKSLNDNDLQRELVERRVAEWADAKGQWRFREMREGNVLVRRYEKPNE